MWDDKIQGKYTTKKPMFIGSTKISENIEYHQEDLWTINKYAKRYKSNPTIKAKLIPRVKATNTISVDPNIEAVPFTAKPQSTKCPTRSAAFGKGIPIKNPNGVIKMAEQIILQVKLD
jgi:hypothetical protein